MSKALRRRLAKLEARTNVRPRKPMILIRRIIKSVGAFGEVLYYESDRAEANGEVWIRNSGESMEEFENRVVADLSKRETSAFGIRVLFLPREEP
jgi:hypothetical protein